MSTKVYKVTVVVIDVNGELDGPDDVKDTMENVRYPNRCMAPHVLSVDTKEVEWSDDHPLNCSDTHEQAVRDLFKEST